MLARQSPKQSYPATSASPAHWLSTADWKAFEDAGTAAHRACSLHGAWVERLGEDLLINHQSPALLASLLEEWKLRAPAYAYTPQRIFSRPLPLQNAERSAPVLLEGDPALPVETVVSESRMRFGLDFSAGYSVGLFLDQRANRALLRTAPLKRVLNTFAYTCSFSVAAALAGAETLSVDLSQKSLERGRHNFVLNELDPSAHRFVADDVQDLLPRLARRKEQFDAIILDPPTFSRGNKGRRFRAEDDLQALLSAALEITAPGGRILLSTNCTKLRVADLETIARFALKNARLQGTLQHSPPLVDFPVKTGASTLWIQRR
ncbi:MAG: 23S rRNA (cytosine1962-C5)-methyltransferase [Verrucomicrobia bacterium]|nr:MAG: 23S rRNA (cytosine1962-C5)-methyltransferase [Verrucomicrobiota bacterium]